MKDKIEDYIDDWFGQPILLCPHAWDFRCSYQFSGGDGAFLFCTYDNCITNKICKHDFDYSGKPFVPTLQDDKTEDLCKTVEKKVVKVLSSNDNIDEVEVKCSEIDGDQLNIDIAIKPKASLETVDVTFDKPEGMSDEQFEVLIKKLQKAIEEQNIHEGELTS